MSNTVKFSIIIPIYNCMNFLDKSIQSVLRQDYDNWELILIDDGSTDNSLDICLKYQELDNRIIVISQKNEGPSVARNKGLELAKGDYIVFLDSDDWLDTNLFKYVSKTSKLKDVDAFVGTFNTILEADNAYPLMSEKINRKYVNNCSGDDVLHYFYRLRLVLTVWRFIIKRDVFINNEIRFTPNILHEDEEIMPILLTKCNSFHLVPFAFYNYRIRNHSITTSKTLYNFKCYIYVAQSLLKQAELETNEAKQLFLMRYAYNDLYMAHWGVKTFSKPIKKIKPKFSQKKERKKENSIKLLGIKNEA